jgi:hypothetical protein
MKKINIISTFVLLICIGLFTSCDDYDRPEIVHEIYADQSTVDLFVGEQQQLKVSPSDVSDVTWTSDDDNIATVVNGLISGVAEGSTTIKAKSGASTFVVSVTVRKKVALTDVILSATDLDMVPGENAVLTATPVPSGANDVALANARWWSDDESIARVDLAGKVTTMSKEGNTTIHYQRGTVKKDVAIHVSFTKPFMGPHTLSKADVYEMPFINFDFGGSDKAWHDTTSGNSGGSSYRADNGDYNAADVDAEGETIGYTDTGEWLQYTIDVQDAGTYQVDLCVAGYNTGTAHFLVDGINASGPISIYTTSSWSDFKYTSKTKIKFTEGRHKLKFYMDTATYNLKSMKFTYLN